jgi:hypothetical protein
MRAVGGSRIEKHSQVKELQELLTCMSNQSEREGFNMPRFLNLCRALSLSPNLRSDNDFARLADVLFLHGFIPSRDAF